MLLKSKVAIVLGTRPEIIKMSPIIRYIIKKNINYYIIHSGQHYSYNMDKVFFEQLQIPKPKYKLEVGSKSPRLQTALIISGTEKILEKNRPTIVLVQGDTNTVLGGAIAAKKCGIPVGHVEAGLRSYDDTMPEELNRIATDHVSDYLFAPTEQTRKILLQEGINKKKIFVTGNTIVDSVYQNYKYIERKKSILKDLDVNPKEFFLVSLHRQENVDNPKRFKNIIEGIKLVQKEFDIPIIYPIHPRSKKMADKFKINFGNIKILDPQDYLTFLFLEKNAKLVMTDSGGVQEEVCILKVPCVTLRKNTERPETIQVGANLLAGTNDKKILESVKNMLKKRTNWKNPFGNGKSSERIVRIINQNYK